MAASTVRPMTGTPALVTLALMVPAHIVAALRRTPRLADLVLAAALAALAAITAVVLVAP